MRLIEAMIACILLISGISITTYLSGVYSLVDSSDLEKDSENILNVLSDPEVIRKITSGEELYRAQLKTLIEAFLPPNTMYNVTLVSRTSGETIWAGSNTIQQPSSGSDVVSGRRVVTISFSKSRVVYRNVDVMLVIDRSGSMAWEDESGLVKIEAAKQAAEALVDQLNMSRDRVGLASFSTTATLDCELTNDTTAIKNGIQNLIAQGWTNMGGGIKRANDEFQMHGRNDTMKVMVLLSDGVANYYYDENGQLRYGETQARQYALDQANQTKNLNVRIYTIGLGDPSYLDPELLKEIASEDQYYYYSPTAGALKDIYLAIAEDFLFQVKNDIIVIQIILFRFG